MVWDEISPALEPYFTLTSVDLLGYGHSPKPRTEYTPALHVETIRRTLRRAGIDPPYTLVGLSMGANLVLEFARRWPDEVSGLIGIGFPYYPSEEVARAALQHNIWIRLTLRHPIVAAVATPVIWRVGRHTVGLFPNHSMLYSPPVAADALRARYFAFRSSLFNCMVHFRQDDVLEASGKMRRLFIHGDDDQWAGPRGDREAAGQVREHHRSGDRGAAQSGGGPGGADRGARHRAPGRRTSTRRICDLTT